MNNQDKLQRFLFENMPVRGELVRLNQTFQMITEQQNYPPLIQRLLGEALVLTSLLAAIIKFKGRLSLQFQSKSGLKLILVQSNQDLELRALAQWDGELDEKEVLDSLQKGVLVIMMDPDTSTKRYQGIVAWKGDSLAQSIEGYFKDSEQLLTRIWVAVDEKKAAGLLLQMMPRTSNETEPTDDWQHLMALTNTLKDDELLNLDTEMLLHRLYFEEDIRIFDSKSTMFKCTCSQERGENAILMLGREEAEEELQNKQVIVVRCDFCSKEFVFDKVDVAKIFHQGDAPPPSTQVH